MRTKFNGILTLLLVLFVQISFAQEKTISGTVADESGPLPGVTVIKKGTTQGTETDFNGNYTIKVKNGEVLVFSFVGMKTVEKTVGASNQIDVMMENDNLLEEVVVTVAYAEKKRKDIIGAVSVVTAEEIGEQKVTTVTEALQGASGLSLVNTSGQPGASPTIRIRGIGTLSGDASPLIIIDGSQFTGNLNAINFNDVAAYSVLKDADATSIYGNRGANGVIIITTKSGSDTNGNNVISVETSFGFQDKATDDYSYLNAQQILETSWTADRNDRVANGTSLAVANQQASAGLVTLLKANPYDIAEPIGTDGKLKSNARLLYETNLLDVLTQEATRQDVAISVTGGTEKNKYYLSGSFLKSDGYTLLSKFERFTGRMNLSSEIKDWLTVGGSASVTFSDSNQPIQAGSRFSNNIQYVRSVSSIYPLYQRNPDGSFILDASGNKQYDFAETRGFFGNYNPLADTYGNQNKFERSTVVVSPFVELTFNDHFKFKSQFNYTNYLFESNIFNNQFTGTTQEQIDGRSSQKERSTTKSWNQFNTLTYKQSFNDVHNVTAVLGQEMFSNSYNFLRTTNTGFVFPSLDELDNGNGATEARSFTNTNRLFSYFGRLDYNYDELYYVGGSIRRDGTSRFSSDTRYGTFWSAAVAWNAAKQFFDDSNDINTLKLRASYGVVGNQNLGNAGLFPYVSEYGTGFNILSTGGVFLTTLGNVDLKWEQHEKLNLGLDFGFFNNRINGSIEYYDNKVKDLIYFLVREPSVGSGGDSANDLASWQNIGELSNKGFELTLNTTNIQTDDFRWTSTLNLSHNRSRIVSIPAPNPDGSFRWESGRDRYEFYMREWAGVDPATGAPLWYQEVTNPTTGAVTKQTTTDYADATRVYTGKSALPDVEGRLGTNFKYKNFDLGLNFNFKFGHYIYNSDYASLMKARNPGEQLSVDVLNAWQNPGDITDVPKLTLGNDDFSARSTRWLQQGDYVRLKNIAFGYNLDNSLIEKFNLKSLRIYLSADNYWTWKKEDNIDDPEQSLNGITNNSSTVLKTMTLGVNVSF